MKLIALTRGFEAIVDDEDFERVAALRWHVRPAPHTFYAARKTPRIDGRQRTLAMHRFILGELPVSLDVDHVNGNGLDNRRANLRACTAAENSRNKRFEKRAVSGLKGVFLNKKTRPGHRRFSAMIHSLGKTSHLGSFRTATEAALAYDVAAREMFGDFAVCNYAPGVTPDIEQTVDAPPPVHGDEHNRAKLRAAQIPYILEASKLHSACDIAAEFGVDESTIRAVLTGKSWKRITTAIKSAIPEPKPAGGPSHCSAHGGYGFMSDCVACAANDTAWHQEMKL